MGLALRASLIWHDEVMQDVVCKQREPVTLGRSGATTFVTPDLGLPEDFAVLRSGERGYVLTLGPRMRGTMCIGGVATSVEDFVRRGSDATPFHATSIECADWGVIELDETGVHKLFFQFVPIEDAQPVLTRGMLVAGGVGWAVGSLVLTALWLTKGLGVAESLFRGAGLVTLALGGALFLHRLLKNDNESRASLVFSMVLHAAFLFMTFQVYATNAAHAWPQERANNASYYVARLDQRIVAPDPVVATKSAFPTVSSSSIPSVDPRPAPVANPMPTTRVRAPATPSRYPSVVTPPRTARPANDPSVIGGDIIAGIAARDVSELANAFRKVKPGKPGGPEVPGPPGGLKTRPGDGSGDPPPGPPGPPTPLVIPVRPPVGVCIDNCGGGPTLVIPPEDPPPDGPTLTEEDVRRPIRARAGLFRTCFQKEVNQRPDLKGGSVVVKFKIAPSGGVVSATKVGGTMTDARVGECVLLNVRKLQYPKSGGANVTFPFVFNI